jgi:hypothetical protein
MSSLSYETILEAFSSLSFSDKLRLNEELATAMRKEGKSGAVGKAIKKEKKVKDPSAPAKIRKTAVGTMAWIAFVKHCKTTMAERFEDCTKEPERLQVAKAIRAEDEAAYKEFTEKFKEEHAVAASDEESDSASVAPAPAVTAPAPAPKAVAPVLSVDEKKAKLAAMKEKKPATGGGAAGGGGAADSGSNAAGGGPKKVVAKEEKKVVVKEEKKAKEAKPPKEVKAKKEPKKVAAKEEEAPEMATKEIDGSTYFFDPETNGLWQQGEDGGFGAWVGKFQPGNEEDPIRFTDSPADE